MPSLDDGGGGAMEVVFVMLLCCMSWPLKTRKSKCMGVRGRILLGSHRRSR